MTEAIAALSDHLTDIFLSGREVTDAEKNELHALCQIERDNVARVFRNWISDTIELFRDDLASSKKSDYLALISSCWKRLKSVLSIVSPELGNTFPIYYALITSLESSTITQQTAVLFSKAADPYLIALEACATPTERAQIRALSAAIDASIEGTTDEEPATSTSPVEAREADLHHSSPAPAEAKSPPALAATSVLLPAGTLGNGLLPTPPPSTALHHPLESSEEESLRVGPHTVACVRFCAWRLLRSWYSTTLTRPLHRRQLILK